MRNFVLGLLLGISLTGNALLGARAMGISMDGVSSKALVATMLLAGTVSDRGQAYRLAEALIAGK